MANEANGLKRISQGIEIGWKVIGIIGVIVIWFIGLEIRNAHTEWQLDLAKTERAALRLEFESEKARNDARDAAINNVAKELAIISDRLERRDAYRPTR